MKRRRVDVVIGDRATFAAAHGFTWRARRARRPAATREARESCGDTTHVTREAVALSLVLGTMRAPMSTLALALTTLIAAASSKPPTTVLVLDIAGDAITRDEAGVLRDVLASELAKRRKYSVLTSEDVRRVLDVEAQRQAAGCEGESTCLAEIGAALGADRVLYGNVAKLGDALVVSLSVVDPNDARAFGRDTFQARDAKEASERLSESAEHLFGKPSRVVDEGPPVVTISGGVVALLGAVGVAGLGGTTLYLLNAVQSPDSEPDTKAFALENGDNFVIATVVSGGVLLLGGAIALVGVIVE